VKFRSVIHALAAFAVAALIVAAAAVAHGPRFGPWSQAINLESIPGTSTEVNTAFLDGCPIQSPDGLSLYMASNRPRFTGDTRTDLDIWVARRASKHGPFGAPQNLGEPVNSAADDFCPTPIRGGGLFFVSREALPGSCGLGDIYFTRFKRKRGWSEPQHLGCTPEGPNSALDEQGPSYVKVGRKALLYFSRSSATVPGEIFASERIAAWSFGPAAAVSELNNATANDIQPNVRKDGREVVFSSNRTGTVGGQDIWIATRDSLRDPWSAPLNLGGAVNTAAAETRPSLSRNARTLLFGRAPGPEGMSDIFVTTRERSGSDDDD
jgi:WD40-like Beta Propeller Repeat